jgi:hypothetical protein
MKLQRYDVHVRGENIVFFSSGSGALALLAVGVIILVLHTRFPLCSDEGQMVEKTVLPLGSALWHKGSFVPAGSDARPCARLS